MLHYTNYIFIILFHYIYFIIFLFIYLLVTLLVIFNFFIIGDIPIIILNIIIILLLLLLSASLIINEIDLTWLSVENRIHYDLLSFLLVYNNYILDCNAVC